MASASSNQCYQISAYGQVQGVGFRKTAYKQAKALDLLGFVENRPDGSVLIEIEGEQAKTGDFINWCLTGPLHRFIEDFNYKEVPLRSYVSFDIKV